MSEAWATSSIAETLAAPLAMVVSLPIQINPEPEPLPHPALLHAGGKKTRRHQPAGSGGVVLLLPAAEARIAAAAIDGLGDPALISRLTVVTGPYR